ncbi:hypothetical protein ABKN59_003053 [Abortiporus biennis]
MWLLRKIQLMPSKFRGLESKIWSYKMSVGWELACTDPDQALLCMLAPDLAQGGYVHFMNLFTGENHPTPIHVRVPCPMPARDSLVLLHPFAGLRQTAAICDNYLAILLSRFDSALEREVFTFVVMDWKLCASVYYKQGSGSPSFGFLDDEHLAFVHQYQHPLIEVLEFRTAYFTNHRRLLHLELPVYNTTDHAITDGHLINVFMICDDPKPKNSSPHKAYHTNAPFELARNDRAILLTMEVVYDRGALQDFRLITLASILIKLYDQHTSSSDNHNSEPVYLRWTDWGRKYTRLFSGPFTNMNAWSSCFGTRYVSVEKGFTTILEFNPYAIRRSILPKSSRASGECVMDPNTVETLGDTAVSIETALPYRRYRTHVKVLRSQSVAINESGLALYKNTISHNGMKIYTY